MTRPPSGNNPTGNGVILDVHVAVLWRYPVKSMAGEQLRETRVLYNGFPGDRLVQVRDARGHLVTARSRRELLGHRGTLSAEGEPLVDGRPWDSPDVARDVERAAGAGAHLVRDDSPARFDVLPLLVATDGAIAAFGYDHRRLRPNVILGGVPGLDERRWEGRILRIGDVRIRLEDLRERCVMTTIDPDTGERDVEVLRKIRREFAGTLALNASVLAEGRIKVGDSAELTAT